jgi:hypothetical protein
MDNITQINWLKISYAIFRTIIEVAHYLDFKDLGKILALVNSSL